MNGDRHPRPVFDDERPQKRPKPYPEHPDHPELPPKPDSDRPAARLKPGKKPPLSCAECRRLKLKCDRVFPCSSCCKRGCSEICPNGALQSGRGSRFILANTEQLHSKIVQLCDRVKQLEDALESLQSSCSNAPHPLLHQDLLRIRTSIEIFPTDSPQPNGSPNSENQYPSRNNDAIDHHVQAAAEGLRRLREPEPTKWQVPADILALSESFPVPWQVNMEIRQRIRNMLPHQKDAQYLCEQARQNALWQYNLDGSETFMTNLLHHVYTVPINNLSPRRLALCLMILAIGCSVDLKQPLDSPRAESYYHLARACLCEIPIVEEPSFDLLRALFFMIWYMLTFSTNKRDVGYAWALMGILTKAAQGMGFHREVSRMKIIPEELEQRRVFYWELMNLDCRLSLSLGRPPSLCLVHTDCKRPSYNAGGVYPSREEALYHEWKHAFYVECLNPILQASVAATAMTYEKVMDLDAKVRGFATPSLLVRDVNGSTAYRFLIMQRALVSSGREIALLQLHRSLFNKALSDNPETYTMDHGLAPSILATFSSACNLISATETLFTQEPQLSVRFLGFWFNVFSAGIALSLLVARAPNCHLASSALWELDRLRTLWHRVGKELPCTCKALASLEKSAAKSRKIYVQWRAEVANGHNMTPSPKGLPIAFRSTHPELQDFYHRTKDLTHPPLDDIPTFATNIECPHASLPSLTPDSSKLPSMYQFNSAGLGKHGFESVMGCREGSSSPSPCSRVSDSYNFDFGDLTDQSYMAWF